MSGPAEWSVAACVGERSQQRAFIARRPIGCGASTAPARREDDAHLQQPRLVRSLRVEPDCVVLDDVYAAGVVIGADGANSVVRRLIGAPSAPPRSVAVAIRGYAPTTSHPDEMVIEFARGATPPTPGRSHWRGVGPTSGTACSTGAAPGRAGSCWPRCTSCCPGCGLIPRRCVRTTSRCRRADGIIPTGGATGR